MVEHDTGIRDTGRVRATQLHAIYDASDRFEFRILSDMVDTASKGQGFRAQPSSSLGLKLDTGTVAVLLFYRTTRI